MKRALICLALAAIGCDAPTQGRADSGTDAGTMSPDCAVRAPEWTSVGAGVDTYVDDVAVTPTGETAVVASAGQVSILDRSGSARWTREFPAGWRPHVAGGADGRIVVGGLGELRRYSADGELLASIAFEIRCPVAVGVGPAGLVYAAQVWPESIRVRAISDDGTEAWQTEVPGGGDCTSVSASEEIDLSAAVTGEVAVAKPGVVALLSGDGTLVWSRPLPVIQVHGIAIDDALNVVVAGAYLLTAALGGAPLDGAWNFDAFVASYDRTGAHRWSKRLWAESFDYVYGLAVDDRGNVYATGHFGEGGGSPATFHIDDATLVGTSVRDAFIASWDTLGMLRWTRVMGGDSDQIGRAVAVDACGSVVVGGMFAGETTFPDGTRAMASAGLTPYVTRFTP